MALYVLITKATKRFEAGTVIGYTETMPVPLSNTELAAGLRWVSIPDRTTADIATLEAKVSRRLIKGCKVPSLYDAQNELTSKTGAQILAATEATATAGLEKE